MLGTSQDKKAEVEVPGTSRVNKAEVEVPGITGLPSRGKSNQTLKKWITGVGPKGCT